MMMNSSLGTPIANNSLPKEVQLTDLGTRLKMMGHTEEAMEKYREATLINENYAPAFYNIGVMWVAFFSSFSCSFSSFS